MLKYIFPLSYPKKSVLKSGFYFNPLLENFKIYAKFAKSFFLLREY